MAGFKLDMHEQVLSIELNHPPLNTLDPDLLEGLNRELAAMLTCRGGDRPKVIVLTSGVRGHFCSGIDPKYVLSTGLAGRRRVFLALGDLVETLFFSYVPLVVDISGPAMAGGAVLAALGNFAAIDANAGKISFSEVKVGLPVPRFIQYLVEEKTSPICHAEVLLLGRNIDPQMALEWGFVQEIYRSPDDRDEWLKGMLAKITRLPAAAIAETLRQRRRPAQGMMQEFRQEICDFSDFLTDEFLGRGLAAIARGESPKF